MPGAAEGEEGCPMTLDSLLKGKFRMVGAITVAVLTVAMLIGWGIHSYSRTNDESWGSARKKMVTWQIQRRGITDRRVIDAMLKVERHRFVPEQWIPNAYEDHPLPIGEEQTISQPYIVALMTQLLKPQETDVVLEIGTGSGYQAAILAELVKEVYTIEIVESLGKRAQSLLKELGYTNIYPLIGDGYQGWPEHAPFDKIIVTAAPDHVPEPLIEQLKKGGTMVIPVGRTYQKLLLITKDERGIKQEEVISVRFVPMTGKAEKE